MAKAKAKIDIKRFIELIELSETLNVSTLNEVIQTAPMAIRSDSRQLADHLVEEGLLTRWQCDHLLSGKYRGFRIGSYQIKGKIGRGGMSTVYLGEHVVMKRQAAIKVLPRKRVEDSSYLARFHREAEAVASFDHPNVVRIFDVSVDGDVHYIAMEYIHGHDLRQLVNKAGPLDCDLAADYIAQAAIGLQHAHDCGFVHRDIKPANLLANERGVVKVLDMGLAKFNSDDHDLSISKEFKEATLGTVDFLPPEQASDSQAVDHRADIYGLGCTLYFLLAGHVPFPKGTMAQRISKHLRSEPTPLIEKRPGIPTDLADLCNEMMAKDPDYRPQSAREVADRLEEYLATRGKSITGTDEDGSDSSIRSAELPPGSMTPRMQSDEGTVVSRSQEETRKSLDSKISDNPKLAPLENEEDDFDGPTTGATKEDADPNSDVGERHEEPTVDVHSLEKQIQPLTSAEDQMLMRAKMPDVEVPSLSHVARSDEGIPQWLWPILGLVGIAIFALIIAVLF